MAKEIRDVIAREEQFAAEAQNPQAVAWLESLRNQIDFGRRKGYLRVRLPRVTQEDPARPQPETPTNPVTFTEQERETLVADGAVLYLPTGETIKDQRAAGRKFWHVADGFKEGERNRLTEFPSRRIEVAIYPGPERFFVPGSFNKTTDQQDVLAQQDAEEIRKRLGLENIGIVRPEASEVTEVMFKHFDTTKARLLGETFREQASGYLPYIRTNTPTNKSGSNLASVGYFSADDGPRVDDWYRDVHRVFLAAARWLVSMGDR